MKHDFVTIQMKDGDVITTFSPELIQLATQSQQARNLCQNIAALFDKQWRMDGLTEKSPSASVAVQTSADDGRCGWTGILGSIYLQSERTTDLNPVSKDLLRDCTALWALAHPEHKPLEAMPNCPVYKAEVINRDDNGNPTLVRIAANGNEYHSELSPRALIGLAAKMVADGIEAEADIVVTGLHYNLGSLSGSVRAIWFACVTRQDRAFLEEEINTWLRSESEQHWKCRQTNIVINAISQTDCLLEFDDTPEGREAEARFFARFCGRHDLSFPAHLAEPHPAQCPA